MDLSVKLNGRYYRMYPRGDFKGHAEKTFVLNPDNTAFVVVDVYGPGFDDGAQDSHYSGMVSAQSAEREKYIIINNIVPALEKAREVGFPVVYVANSAPRIALAKSTYWEYKVDTQDVDVDALYSELPVDPKEYHHGDSNVLLYSKVIAPQATDYFVRKHVHTGFFDTRLDTLLRNLGVKNLLFVGFALDHCLGTTMIDALWRNYRPILLRDCTYAIEIEGIDEPGAYTDRWILYVESAVGYTTSSPEFIHACDAALREAQQPDAIPERVLEDGS
jgi:ureidoacrylate peracid hydrolase